MASFSDFGTSENLSTEDLVDIIQIGIRRRKICIIGFFISFALYIAYSECSSIFDYPAWMEYLNYFFVAIVGFFAGYGIFVHNVLCYIKSHGERKYSLIVSLVWGLFGFIVLPLIIVLICNRVFPYKNYDFY